MSLKVNHRFGDSLLRTYVLKWFTLLYVLVHESLGYYNLLNFRRAWNSSEMKMRPNLDNDWVPTYNIEMVWQSRPGTHTKWQYCFPRSQGSKEDNWPVYDYWPSQSPSGSCQNSFGSDSVSSTRISKYKNLKKFKIKKLDSDVFYSAGSFLLPRWNLETKFSK